MNTRWILLRGLTREAGHWGGFPAALARATDGAVEAVDLPGNGSRWRERSPSDVRAMAEDLHSRLPAHEGPAVVVAMSLGAMVALELAARHPGAVQGCVLVNTSAGDSPLWHRLRPAAWGPFVRMLLPGAAPARRERWVLALTSGDPARHPDAVARWTSLAARQPVGKVNALCQLWAAARFRAPGQPPPVPMLLVASARDGLVSPACSRRLAARWRLPLVEHPWAGHDLPLDDPEWLLGQLTQWWRDHAPQAGAPHPSPAPPR